jgi:hypothetical protein
MYNLTAIVNFPTRINNTPASAIDNFFMDISCLEDFLVTPFLNDLSDHYAQILTINFPIQIHPDKPKYIRKIDKLTTLDFIYNLSNVAWDSVFDATDVNLMFNSFLNTYLRIFYSCFPLIRIKSSKYNNNWITIGIRTSCKRKRELFLLTRSSNNAALKQYYKVYCKILTKVIKDAKRMTLNKRIFKSNSKTKTTWNIINELLGKQQSMQGMQKLIIEGTQLTLRRLMSYIYGAPILDVSRSHTTTQHSR